MKKLFLIATFAFLTLSTYAQGIVDAAFQWEGSTICFIKGNNVVLYDLSSRKVVKQETLQQAFPGLQLKRVNAALAFNSTYVCLFDGKNFANFDKQNRVADGGSNFITNNSWKGLSFGQYTTAVSFPSKYYFFDNQRYIRYDKINKSADQNYPKAVNGQTWPGLPKYDVQAAFSIGDIAYFFSNTGYVKFDIPSDRSLFTTEHSLNDFPGLKNALNGNVSTSTAPPSNVSTGISFFHGTWDQALAESKKTGKPIFLDAYASWCGPCKYMAKTAFKDGDVGKVYNKKFINVKMDMEKGIGPELARKYGLTAYPTLYFLNGSGDVLKKVVGGQSASNLITLANGINNNGTAAASNGIEFFHGSWDEALAESRKTGKPIFLDAYATWCGPCKYMAKTAFKDPSVGALYNQKFINVKMDMEKGRGPELARKYGLTAYPTLYFINGSGNVISKKVGGQSANGLVSWGKTIN